MGPIRPGSVINEFANNLGKNISICVNFEANSVLGNSFMKLNVCLYLYAHSRLRDRGVGRDGVAVGIMN